MTARKCSRLEDFQTDEGQTEIAPNLPLNSYRSFVLEGSQPKVAGSNPAPATTEADPGVRASRQPCPL